MAEHFFAVRGLPQTARKIDASIVHILVQTGAPQQRIRHIIDDALARDVHGLAARTIILLQFAFGEFSSAHGVTTIFPAMPTPPGPPWNKQ